MRLAPIVLQLRLSNTRFGNFIAGAGELVLAMSNTLQREMAFVIPLGERADKNDLDLSINQIVVERFAVVVALINNSSQADKTGLTAFDLLHDIRSQIFRSIVNIELVNTESSIYYVGGTLLDISPAYLWYQFEFEFKSRITADIDGVSDIQDRVVSDRQQVSQLPTFESIYANIISTPDARIPYNGTLPLDDSFPDVLLPDMAVWIDLTKDPDDGAFSRSFCSAFDIDTHNK